MCFGDPKYLRDLKRFPEGCFTFGTDCNLTIRLGDGSKAKSTEYAECKIVIDGKESIVIIYLMNLPQGIDIIMGLNWMDALGVVLDTRNRRIVYNDINSCSVAQSSGPAPELIPIQYLLPCKVESDSINKAVLNNIYSNINSSMESDIHLCSANTMRALIKSFKNKDLNYRTYENIAHPKTIGKTDSQSHCELFSIQLAHLNKNGRKTIKKARLKVLDKLSKNKVYSKVDEQYVQKLLSMARESTVEREIKSTFINPQGELNVIFNSRGVAKARAHSNIEKSNTIDNLSMYANGPDTEETAWMVDIIISPDGTITIPEFDTHTGVLNDNNIINSDLKNDDLWRQAADPILKQYKDSKQAAECANMAPEPQCNYKHSNIAHLFYNSEADMPTPCNIPPSDINTTAPEAQDWVDKLVSGKIRKFECFNPDVHYNDEHIDKPHNIEIKEGATVPTPHKYRTPEHLVSELKKFIQEMLSKGWIETVLGFQDKNEMKLDIGQHGHRPTARANATVTPWTIDTTTTLYCGAWSIY